MGVKTLYNYFYKLAYGDKGADKATLVNDCLDLADAEIKTNKDARHTQNTDTDLDATFEATFVKESELATNIVLCSNYAHPDDAITVIGADNKTLLVTEVEICDTNFTVPANVTVKFERGGKWTINTGITVTFNGQINAGLWQIFEYIGTGVLAGNPKISCAYPQWWGTINGDTITDAIDFLPDNGGTVYITESATLTSTIEVNHVGIRIVGTGTGRITTEPVLIWNGTVGSDSKMIHVANNQHGFALERIRLDGAEKADHCLHVQADSASSTHDVYLSRIHFVGYRVYGLVLGTDSIVDASNAQMRIVTCDHLVFQGGLQGASGILINAQNAEFVNFFSLYIDPEVGHEHTNHIYCFRGGVQIFGMTTTRATNYPIITYQQLNIYGWRAEDRYLIDWKAVDIEAPCFITGIQQRSGAGAVYNDSTIKIYATNQVITLSSIMIQGSIYFGATDVRLINAQGIDFKLSGAGFIFAGGQNQSGIFHDVNTGNIQLRGSAPAIMGRLANGTIKWGISEGQVIFPATQNPSTDANILDDYEEGTWTMGVSFGGGTTGITYSSNTGYYTKIGNIVTISGYLVLTSKGTSTGDAFLTGLPFTVVNNNAGYTAVNLWINAINFGGQVQGYASKNTSTISFNQVTEAGVISSLTNTNFADNSQIMVNCTYRIN